MSLVLPIITVSWTGYGVQHAVELIHDKRESTWQADFLARFKSQSQHLPRTEEITTKKLHRGTLSPCRESKSGSPEFDSAVLVDKSVPLRENRNSLHGGAPQPYPAGHDVTCRCCLVHVVAWNWIWLLNLSQGLWSVNRLTSICRHVASAEQHVSRSDVEQYLLPVLNGTWWVSVGSPHHDNDGNLGWRKPRRLATEHRTDTLALSCSEIWTKNVVYSVGIIHDTICNTSCNTKICAFHLYSIFMWFSVQAASLSLNSSNWWILAADVDYVLCGVYVHILFSFTVAQQP
jgi:hypothetical protein